MQNKQRLYELVGRTWTELTPPGTWRSIMLTAVLAGKAYFRLRDTSWDYHLYGPVGGTLTELDPPGMQEYTSVSAWLAAL